MGKAVVEADIGSPVSHLVVTDLSREFCEDSRWVLLTEVGKETLEVFKVGLGVCLELVRDLSKLFIRADLCLIATSSFTL